MNQDMNPLDEADDLDELDELVNEYSQDPEFVESLRAAEDLFRLKVELQTRRRALGLSQTQVAQSMNTTQSHVSEFENGGSDPHLSTFQRYARSVGMRLSVSLEVRSDARRLNVINSHATFAGKFDTNRIVYRSDSLIPESSALGVAC